MKRYYEKLSELGNLHKIGTQVQVKVSFEKCTQVQVKIIFLKREKSTSKSTLKSTRLLFRVLFQEYFR